MSYPNQKILKIKKPRVALAPFLQISEDDWQEAAIILTRSAFILYLLLAQNQADFAFEFSPRAIERAKLMSHSTAVKARQELEAKGYIEDGCFYVQSARKRTAQQQIQQEVNKVIEERQR